MDRFKEKLTALRDEADTLTEQAEQTEAQVKKAREGLTERDQELLSLKSRVKLLEGEASKAQIREKEHATDGHDDSHQDPDDLANVLLDLEAQVEEERANLTAVNGHIREADIKVENLQRDVTKLKNEKRALIEESEKLTQELEAIKKETNETLALLEEL